MQEYKGVAHSALMRNILEKAKNCAELPRPVLIRGERGTGKELLARYIHDCSPRKNGVFQAVNCAAFNDELLNAEIFGYEKGAFTGANEARPGRLEQCDGGTLFLDEVGSMSPAFQDRILASGCPPSIPPLCDASTAQGAEQGGGVRRQGGGGGMVVPLPAAQRGRPPHPPQGGAGPSARCAWRQPRRCTESQRGRSA